MSRVLALVAIVFALVLPWVVLLLRIVGVIGDHQFYPHPAAWPTILTSAFVLVCGLNVVAWLAITRHGERPRASSVTAALIVLIPGSIVAVAVVALAEILIYLQFSIG